MIGDGTLLMKSCGLMHGILAFSIVCATSPLLAQTIQPQITNIERQDPDIDVYALMTGNCPTLKIAGNSFRCKTIGFFHGLHGRVSFTVVVDDPADKSHIVSFSGPGSRQSAANVYNLAVDRVFLNSQHRPRADGVPVPLPVATLRWVASSQACSSANADLARSCRSCRQASALMPAACCSMA